MGAGRRDDTSCGACPPHLCKRPPHCRGGGADASAEGGFSIELGGLDKVFGDTALWNLGLIAVCVLGHWFPSED